MNNLAGAQQVTSDVPVARSVAKEQFDDLFRQGIGELRRLAQHIMGSYHLRGRSLARATALVGELYDELTGNENVPLEKPEFFRYSAKVMRRLIVRDLRETFAQKRGGGHRLHSLEYARNIEEREDLDLPTVLTLDAALDRLALEEPVLSTLVDLRFFVGLTIAEAAEVLELSPATVKRYWRQALDRLKDDVASSPHALPHRQAMLDALDKADEGAAQAGGVRLPVLEQPVFHLLHEEERSLERGTRIGDYVVEKHVDTGGSAEVYRAYRHGARNGRRFAIKLLRPDRVYSELFMQTFLAEESSRSIHHPALVSVLDYGVSETDRPFLVLPFVNGLPIDTFCEKPGMDLARRLELFEKLCEPIGYLHDSNIVHCDLKPTNILVDAAARIHVLDLGAAQFSWRSSDSKRPVDQLSALYASPERVHGQMPTPSADVYSLGIILLELVTGKLFERRQLSEETLDAIWRGPSPELAKMIFDHEETLRRRGERRCHTIGWRDSAVLRRESLRAAKLLGPLLQKTLAPDPLERLELPEFRERLADARRVCIRFDCPDEQDN